MALTQQEAFDYLLDAVETKYPLEVDRSECNYPDEPSGWNDVEAFFWKHESPEKALRLDSDVIVYKVAQSGGEGQGDEQSMVFSIILPDNTEELWRKDGYYSSYDGGEWEGDFYAVEAVVKPVVFYERKK